MKQHAEGFILVRKSLKSIPIKFLANSEECYQKLLKNSERKITNNPPFEGSLQQRSYPKLAKIEESELAIIKRIGMLISAYNSRNVLREEIIRSKSTTKTTKTYNYGLQKNIENFKKKSNIKSYLNPISLKKKSSRKENQNIKRKSNLTPIPEKLSAWEIND